MNTPHRKKSGLQWTTPPAVSRLLFLCLLIPTATRGQDVRLGGFLQLDKRFDIGGSDVTIADFYNRFRFEMNAPLGKQLYVFTSVDFRFYDLSRVRSLVGLENLEQGYPTDLSLWESYIDVYDFLVDGLDVRFGKQRLAWGTADKLNPTDNLNPDDFSDLVNFTEKIPTWAAKVSYYIGDYTITGVWLPSLTPILLPRNSASLFLGEQSEAFQSILLLPAPLPRNSMFALKVDGNAGAWDYSLSYFNGYDDVPILREVNIPVDQTGSASGSLNFGFPRIQVIGLDFATELSGAGFWGEGALFFPEEQVSRINLGRFVSTNIELAGAPYFKFTVGGDYTFSNGVYLNGQWMHGFFTERGGDALHDYFIVELEKKLLKDEIKISFGAGLEISRWNKIQDNYGYGLFPKVTYAGVDNLEMTAGVFIAGGKTTTLFGSWNAADQVYTSIKASF
ncbi:MAG: hypothetical protein GXO82_02060 [Chlorobi bacterium]|nr:hypothetical protein [Chlorobiota bacterium]